MNAPAALLFTLLEGCSPSGHPANASSEQAEVPRADFSTLTVAASPEACLKEEIDDLKVQLEAFWGSPKNSTLTQRGFPFQYSQEDKGPAIQLNWALNEGLDGKGASGFLAEVGHTIYRDGTAALKPYHDQWQGACPGGKEEDFYRSAYLLEPAFGPLGFARCLPVKDRCGDF